MGLQWNSKVILENLEESKFDFEITTSASLEFIAGWERLLSSGTLNRRLHCILLNCY
jgi:hypothetical protein